MGQKGFGVVLLTVAAFMLLGLALNLGQGFGLLAYGLALSLCVALPAAGGVALLRSPGARVRLRQVDDAWNAELLRLAERRGGALTVSEVVAHADLSPEDAERRLEGFCANGSAEHCVSDDGVIVYRFQRLLTEEQKQSAAGVLDD